MAYRLFILFSLISILAFTQVNDSLYKEQRTPLSISLEKYKDIPEYQFKTKNIKSKTLPQSVDNSQNIFFPPSNWQAHYSCGQFAGVYYNYTYEVNRLRGTDASDSENRFSPYYTFCLFNNGIEDVGVNYFDSWSLIRDQGHPNENEYLFGYENDYFTYSLWMNGYDSYESGMSNRLKDFFAIKVNSIEGLNQLKQWLYDHDEGSPYGGVANIYMGSNPEFHDTISEGPYTGEWIALHWSYNIGHALTIVGYEDSIRYDFNGDGQYTNDIDINGDSIVDLKDYEIGAFLIQNSYWHDWANGNKIWMPYRVMALRVSEGGVWENEAHVLVPEIDHQTKLTANIKITHYNRSRISIRAGIALDTTQTVPEKYYTFPIFCNQGGDFLMQGLEWGGGQTIEVGMDWSKLLYDIPSDKPVKVFLIVDEIDHNDEFEGGIKNFSLYDKINDTIFDSQTINQDLLNDTCTIIPLIVQIEHDLISISDSLIIYEDSSEIIEHQLFCENFEGNVTWSLPNSLIESEITPDFPVEPYENLHFVGLNNGTGILGLNFNFPFFGQEYDTILMNVDGYLKFEGRNTFYPYILENEYAIRTNNIIAPFFNDMRISSGDGLFFKREDEMISLIWRASKNGVLPSKTECFCAVTLHSNGMIDFHYDSLSYQNHKWMSAISNGDEVNYIIPSTSNKTNQAAYRSFRFSKYEQSEFSLTENGLLTFIPESSPDSVIVRVEDENGNYDIKTIRIKNDPKYEDELFLSYPNPFTDLTNLEFSLSQNSPVKIQIYDIQGKLIYQYHEEDQPKGKYQMSINFNTMPTGELRTGVYYLKFSGGGLNKIQKIVRIKP